MAKRFPRLSADLPSITRPRIEHKTAVDWGGVRIVSPIIQVPRLLPGRRGTTRIPTDVRAFVPSRPSVVVSGWVEARLAEAARRHAWLEPALRGRRRPASFDTVAHLLADAVFDHIAYRRRGGATWQLPEETLELEQGDCEDRATLLASALVASGISPYNVRVALGTVRVSGGRRASATVAHAWVVYRGENGYWSSLEPAPSTGGSKYSALAFEYAPELVFNGDHQWSLEAEPPARARARWNSLDTRFHGEVHRSIVSLAAAQAKVPAPLAARLTRTFTTLFGNVIDLPDLHFRSYDPRDHFDTGLIDDSWRVVKGRLASFYAAPITDSAGIDHLCWALHAIADFYAHSTYAHFLQAEKRAFQPYDPTTGQPALRYDYANDPAFSRARLSFYEPWWKPGTFDRLARWKGRPISGRYSLSGDSHDTIEKLTSLPPPSAFPTPAARAFAGSLPHHEEIAVDEGKGKNSLYPDVAVQYAWRFHLALRHMVGVLKAHRDIA